MYFVARALVLGVPQASGRKEASEKGRAKPEPPTHRKIEYFQVEVVPGELCISFFISNSQGVRKNKKLIQE